MNARNSKGATLRRRTLLVAAGAGASLAVPWAANAQPGGAIRLILPLPPGGATDGAARTLVPRMSEKLGQTVVVDNRPGADGAIAATAVIRAKPDGQTLLFSTNTAIVAVPALRKQPPYDPLTELTAIAGVGTLQTLFLVHGSVPVKTMAEFVEYARARAGQLNFASAHSTAMLVHAQLQQQASIQLALIPYKGDAPAFADLLSGRVQAMVASPGAPMQHIRAGTVRALAALSPTRLVVAPEVPTMAEASYPGVSLTSWAAIYGPAQMPRDMSAKISRAVAETLAAPEVQTQLANYGIGPRVMDPDQAAAFTRDQLTTWRDLVRAAGIAQE
ncbi:Bug family tripartite tricarboxylate transporter substrate binding protein [Ramlibacter sp.]|uniref:Bug family tripartite tricarboxylate transporter substrate binding protein n=1 Tax=Ramlibacter sp. TaxID=1917967 RepID=UPI003D0FCDAE